MLFPHLPEPARLEVDVLFEMIEDMERSHAIRRGAGGRGKPDWFAAVLAALLER